ncbi:MAG TPA: hypothetical protein VJB94_01770 [Candidatus Nanoarchaeia archaeon]|nr:hypothetical protein [Candidatus Nanoarchaeia archaeon]
MKISFFLVPFIFIALVASVLYFNFSVEILYFDVVVGDHVGFNLDADKIHFGTIPAGNSADRDIFVTSDKDARIEIFVDDVDFVHPSINNFLISPGEKKKVTMTASVPSDAKQGLYEGQIKIYSKRT